MFANSGGPGKGSQVTFWVPRRDDDLVMPNTELLTPRSENEVLQANSTGDKKTVLLVEDNPINQLVVK
jgi:hypothetical protein